METRSLNKILLGREFLVDVRVLVEVPVAEEPDEMLSRLLTVRVFNEEISVGDIVPEFGNLVEPRLRLTEQSVRSPRFQAMSPSHTGNSTLAAFVGRSNRHSSVEPTPTLRPKTERDGG